VRNPTSGGPKVVRFDTQEALFQATSGLPRKNNLLAHHALLAAALGRAKCVSADHVQAAMPEVS